MKKSCCKKVQEEGESLQGVPAGSKPGLQKEAEACAKGSPAVSRKESGVRQSRLRHLANRWFSVAPVLILGLGGGLGLASLTAAETEESQEKAEVQELDEILTERVEVVGSAVSARSIPGAAHYLGPQELEAFGDSDLHRILRKIPGLNVQEEDGYGLRLNIGLRGTGVERSSKITLMEDGVLIAPAPYSAPAAYYSPSAGRMEAIEVRKGSAAIKQGRSRMVARST